MDLDFEQPLRDIRAEIDALEAQRRKGDSEASARLSSLRRKLRSETARLYRSLSPWETVQVARHPGRPTIADYAHRMCDEFIELHGDRCDGDDPAILGGFARIFGSVEAFDRAYALHPSPANAVTFCQANFKLMGADLEAAARHFGDRIAYIHVRDVAGSREDFVELFHDQGTTDQFALMRTYRELGLDVPLRGDHVPEMAFDRALAPGSDPGYGTLGRLFANGYLKALLAGTGTSGQRASARTGRTGTATQRSQQ